MMLGNMRAEDEGQTEGRGTRICGRPGAPTRRSNEKAANLALGVAPSGNDLSIYCVCATFVGNVTKSH